MATTNGVQQNHNHNHNHKNSLQNGNNSKAHEKIACVEMCFFCFDVLVNHLNDDAPPKDPCFTNEPFPLFVTWMAGKNHRLRGCIGTFEAKNLHNGLREYAITSATLDERFVPITMNEINFLKVSVSILTNFEKANDYLDWQVGVHGIKIVFDERGKRRSATFLPEVATEQKWDHLQTIDSLLRKGGFRGAITTAVRQSITLTRYQSEKITVSYDDYLTWKSNKLSR